jgi:DNA repair exonuclease SbcCD ATPase subunit
VDHEKMTPGVVAEAIEKARIELLHQGPWESIRESERTARLRVLLSAMENAGVLDGLATLRERSAHLSTVTDDLAAARKKLGGIEAAHAAELADALAAHAAELTAADENHRRETDEHTTALDALRAQLTDTDDQLHHAEARATDLDTQLTEARQMLADAQATHAAELTEMKAAHAAELADVSDAPLEDHTAPLAADTPATPEADEPEIPQPPIESLSLLRRILTGSLRSAPDAEGRHREQRDVTTQPPRRSEP